MSELTKFEEAALALSDAINGDVIQLAGKTTVRIVRTPEGAKRFKAPIGSVIIRHEDGSTEIAKKGDGHTIPSAASLKSDPKVAKYNTPSTGAPKAATKKATAGTYNVPGTSSNAPKPPSPAKYDRLKAKHEAAFKRLEDDYKSGKISHDTLEKSMQRGETSSRTYKRLVDAHGKNPAGSVPKKSEPKDAMDELLAKFAPDPKDDDVEIPKPKTGSLKTKIGDKEYSFNMPEDTVGVWQDENEIVWAKLEGERYQRFSNMTGADGKPARFKLGVEKKRGVKDIFDQVTFPEGSKGAEAQKNHKVEVETGNTVGAGGRAKNQKNVLGEATHPKVTEGDLVAVDHPKFGSMSVHVPKDGKIHQTGTGLIVEHPDGYMVDHKGKSTQILVHQPGKKKIPASAKIVTPSQSENADLAVAHAQAKGEDANLSVDELKTKYPNADSVKTKRSREKDFSVHFGLGQEEGQKRSRDTSFHEVTNLDGGYVLHWDRKSTDWVVENDKGEVGKYPSFFAAKEAVHKDSKSAPKADTKTDDTNAPKPVEAKPFDKTQTGQMWDDIQNGDIVFFGTGKQQWKVKAKSGSRFIIESQTTNTSSRGFKQTRSKVIRPNTEDFSKLQYSEAHSGRKTDVPEPKVDTPKTDTRISKVEDATKKLNDTVSSNSVVKAIKSGENEHGKIWSVLSHKGDIKIVPTGDGIEVHENGKVVSTEKFPNIKSAKAWIAGKYDADSAAPINKKAAPAQSKSPVTNVKATKTGQMVDGKPVWVFTSHNHSDGGDIEAHPTPEGTVLKDAKGKQIAGPFAQMKDAKQWVADNGNAVNADKVANVKVTAPTPTPKVETPKVEETKLNDIGLDWDKANQLDVLDTVDNLSTDEVLKAMPKVTPSNRKTVGPASLMLAERGDSNKLSDEHLVEAFRTHAASTAFSNADVERVSKYLAKTGNDSELKAKADKRLKDAADAQRENDRKAEEAAKRAAEEAKRAAEEAKSTPKDIAAKALSDAKKANATGSVEEVKPTKLPNGMEGYTDLISEPFRDKVLSTVKPGETVYVSTYPENSRLDEVFIRHADGAYTRYTSYNTDGEYVERLRQKGARLRKGEQKVFGIKRDSLDTILGSYRKDRIVVAVGGTPEEKAAAHAKINETPEQTYLIETNKYVGRTINLPNGSTVNVTGTEVHKSSTKTQYYYDGADSYYSISPKNEIVKYTNEGAVDVALNVPTERVDAIKRNLAPVNPVTLQVREEPNVSAMGGRLKFRLKPGEVVLQTSNDPFSIAVRSPDNHIRFMSVGSVTDRNPEGLDGYYDMALFNKLPNLREDYGVLTPANDGLVKDIKTGETVKSRDIAEVVNDSITNKFIKPVSAKSTLKDSEPYTWGTAAGTVTFDNNGTKIELPDTWEMYQTSDGKESIAVDPYAGQSYYWHNESGEWTPRSSKWGTSIDPGRYALVYPEIKSVSSAPKIDPKMSDRESFDAINPLYGKKGASGSGVNCMRVSLTWEMRKRGHDVVAKIGQAHLTDNAMLDAMVTKDGERRNLTNMPKFGTGLNTSANRWLENYSKDHPVGSRYFVLMQWKSVSAHIAVAEKTSDGFKFSDAQTGRYHDALEQWNLSERAKDAQIIRVDDLVIADNLVSRFAEPRVDAEKRRLDMTERELTAIGTQAHTKIEKVSMSDGADLYATTDLVPLNQKAADRAPGFRVDPVSQLAQYGSYSESEGWRAQDADQGSIKNSIFNYGRADGSIGSAISVAGQKQISTLVGKSEDSDWTDDDGHVKAKGYWYVSGIGAVPVYVSGSVGSIVYKGRDEDVVAVVSKSGPQTMTVRTPGGLPVQVKGALKIKKFLKEHNLEIMRKPDALPFDSKSTDIGTEVTFPSPGMRRTADAKVKAEPQDDIWVSGDTFGGVQGYYVTRPDGTGTYYDRDGAPSAMSGQDFIDLRLTGSLIRPSTLRTKGKADPNVIDYTDGSYLQTVFERMLREAQKSGKSKEDAIKLSMEKLTEVLLSAINSDIL